MAKEKKLPCKSRASERIAREANALRKNLAKRKLQQSQREQLKKEKNNGQD